MFFSMAVFIVVLFILVTSADYAIYSARKSMMGKAFDCSVSAAVQEIDRPTSREGLGTGFNEAQGENAADNIVIRETEADNAFFSTLEANAGIERMIAAGKTMLVIVNHRDTGLQYIIKKGSRRYEGNISGPDGLEAAINQKIGEFWPSSVEESDSHIVYVNGNPKTNQFTQRPYYMAVIKDFEIDGLFIKRTATFIAFKGARIERQE